MENFDQISIIRITCPNKLSPYLKREVQGLGYAVTYSDPTGVEIEGTLNDCIRLNLLLRTAHKVLFHLGDLKANTPDDLYAGLMKINWLRWIPERGYFSVTTQVSTQAIRDTRFAAFKTKDAIADHFTKKIGKRPDSGPDRSKFVVFLFWKNSRARVFIDTSGNPLSKHNYRLNPFKAPLQETLAAAIVLESGFEGSGNFLNPMCGSGTLAIEAAMMARKIPPGLSRINYSFQHINGFDPRKEREIRNQLKSEISDNLPGRIIASDIDPFAIKAATENASNAGVLENIEFRTEPFEETPVPDAPGVLIFNPEYGVRMGEEATLKDEYKKIGDFMKTNCPGYTGFVISGNDELLKNIGLKASGKTQFYNGKIEARLFKYELYRGSKKEGTVNES